MSTISRQILLHTLDRDLSLAEAQSIGPIPSAQKAEALKVLDPELISNPQVYAALGVTQAEVEAAARERRGLDDRFRGKLMELASSAIFREHVAGTDIAIGDRVSFGLRGKVQLYRDNDPLIATNPLRARQPGVWASTEFMTRPSAGIGVGYFGFSAEATLGIAVLAPYQVAPGAIPDAAKNMSTRLPFTAEKAMALAGGTQVDLRGHGRISASASFGVGRQLAAIGDLVTVGASAGISAGVSTEKELALRFVRLDGNKVYVSLSEIDTRAGNIGVGASIGVDVNLKDIVDFGGGLVSRAADIAAGVVEKQAESWLQASLRAAHHRSKSEREVRAWVFELGQPGVNEAFERLMRLDVSAADAIVDRNGGGFGANGRPLGGVAYAELDEHVRSKTNSLEGNIGKITILRAIAAKTMTTGHYQGTLGETGAGEIDYARVRYDDSYFGIISQLWRGDQNLSRELVSTVTTPQGRPPQEDVYYTLDYSVRNDRSTSQTDVRKLLYLAEATGSLGGQERLLGDKSFHQGFDDTNRVVRLAVTKEGMERFSQASRAQVEQLYAGYTDTMEGLPWIPIGTSWTFTRAIGDRQAREDLETYMNGNLPDDARQQADQGYRARTWRNTNEDAEAMKKMMALSELAEEMRALAQSSMAPAERAKQRAELFAKKDGSVGLGFWATMATMAKLAGPEGVLVDTLALEDLNRGRQLVFAHEGAVQDVRTDIDRFLADPTVRS